MENKEKDKYEDYPLQKSVPEEDTTTNHLAYRTGIWNPFYFLGIYCFTGINLCRYHYYNCFTGRLDSRFKTIKGYGTEGFYTENFYYPDIVGVWGFAGGIGYDSGSGSTVCPFAAKNAASLASVGKIRRF